MAIPAAQNFQVSGTGGAGTSGQGKKYIPGMNQMGSSGTETMAQQGGASMYKQPDSPKLSSIPAATDPTQLPKEDVLNGLSPLGQPNNFAGLPQEPNEDPDVQAIIENLPLLEFWATQPGSSQGTRDYVQYLRSNLMPPENGMAI